MKECVMLEYVFMFDPSQTYQHLYQFEQDLAKFFKEHGMEAEIVSPIGGYQGRKILVIKKAELIPEITEKPIKEGHVQKQVNKLRGGKPNGRRNR